MSSRLTTTSMTLDDLELL